MVARELVSSGHEVVFATGPKYAAWVAERGIEPVLIWTPEPDAVYTRLRKLQPMLTTDEVRQSVEADLKLIDEVQPDAILGDCRNSLRISSALAQVPYAAITNANCTPWYAGPLVIPMAACPNHRLRGLLERYVPKSIIRKMHDVGCRRFAKPFEQIAREKGADVDCSDFRTIFTSDDLTLLADDRQFNPTAHLPEHVKYIGPLFIERDEFHAEATLAALGRLQATNNDGTPRPLIVISTGSTGSHDRLPEFIEQLIPAGYNLAVIGSGTEACPEETPNLIKVPFADPETLLPSTAAVICHGGNGSIYQALSYGKSVLTLPTFFDQQTQSRRLKDLELGQELLGQGVNQLAPLLTEAVGQTPDRLKSLDQTPSHYAAIAAQMLISSEQSLRGMAA
jgi:UDP:flavonoid glycosyltransferase YjiC (YdhE family)